MFGAFSILSLVGIAHTVLAQNPAAEKVVFNFTATTGYYPSGVIRDAIGNLYIATELGGNNQDCTDGCGNILKLSHPAGKATVLYTFGPSGEGLEGPNPSGLVRDAMGNLYGATAYGGTTFYAGTVFKLTPSGKKETLHNFAGGDDGLQPLGGVTIDSAGNLYGTTEYGGGTGCGGSGCGVVYEVTPSGSETILYSFTGGIDGAQPQASPILDASGNLYGTALEGGDLTCPLESGIGCGTAWKLDTSGNLTVLYSFTGSTDGAAPGAGLTMDSSGNLYGDAVAGGDLSCDPPVGCGVVFEINSSGNFAVLHTFTGGPDDGEAPFATLLRDTNGNLYGTTVEGGNQFCESGCGIVFKLNASGNETILHAFTGGTTDGEYPVGPLITNGTATLYGTTGYGGLANGGVVFAVQAR